ncbi:hypothetical protein IE81DRAFT_294374 [Ceraceosorus guamensis]|uniref:Alpha-1,3-glucosyltransferase n=1 Tax=Ceraceosorus guamensis TaxID=1522189 RepID=A0A316VQ91_9BASI|nr:hypothetical protein IE81DRAFT_294374 [Ceraceosorus guamensis]PWN39767.1 hypothetical protein IE81DRAFT_294374 [Ceraceosorus guamensis]
MPGWLRDVLVLSTSVKLLLVPAYHSTDLEVHRHWLALTKTLPVSHWYFDTTSQWTLDYPPFFAFFERMLAQVIAPLDARIVHLQEGLQYASPRAICILRLSVMLTELVLVGALWALATPSGAQSGKSSESGLGSASRSPSSANTDQDAHVKAEQAISPLVAGAILLHPALVIVDHIHFQYNGFLTGVLLWSIWAARERRPLLSAFLFSSLLMLKHIYIYLAPAYFIFLLRTYVHPASVTMDGPTGAGPASRLFTLGTITLIPPLAAILPLLASGLTTSAPAGPLGILRQMIARLFPFQRGLNHAYWAANFWALYSFADRALLATGMATSSKITEAARASSSRGLIGDTTFGVLPTVSASHCLVLTATPLLVLSSRLWTRPTYLNFLTVLISSGLTSFIFGYHVHEKAILLPLLPLTLLAPVSYVHARLTTLLSIVGIFGLFPLLYDAKETPLKLFYTLAWSFVFFGSIRKQVYRPVPSNLTAIAHVLENVYLLGFIILQIYTSLLHPVLFTRERHLEPTKESGPVGTAAEAIMSAADSLTSALIAQPSSHAPWVQASPAGDPLASFSMDASSGETATPSMRSDLSAAGLGSHATPLENVRKLSSSGMPDVQLHTQYEFLPLMLISTYCALGVLWVWIRLGWSLLSQRLHNHPQAAEASLANHAGKQRAAYPRKW